MQYRLLLKLIYPQGNEKISHYNYLAKLKIFLFVKNLVNILFLYLM